MQVEKVLIIESPVMLYKMMDSRPEILDHAFDETYSSLRRFFDSVNIYLNGCRCDIEKNYDSMMDEYSSIQTESISSHLKKCFECDRIDFK